MEKPTQTPTPEAPTSESLIEKKDLVPLLIAVGIIALYIIIAIIGVILVPMFNKYSL
jgi:hypothetical protein